jgi:hypothetical protein
LEFNLNKDNFLNVFKPALMHALDIHVLFVDLFARRTLKTITAAKSRTENAVTPKKTCLLFKKNYYFNLKKSY